MAERVGISPVMETAAAEPASERAPRTERANRGVDRFLRLQQAIGNRATQSLLAGGLLQSKLRIGPVDDVYEREADRTADRVMRMPVPDSDEPSPLQAPISRVQRMCAECEEEEKEEEGRQGPVQRKPRSSAASTVNSGIESRISSLRGGGQPLPPVARSFFEPRFGHDFSDVRLHTGPSAARAAAAINARAFTLGRDIVFGAGQDGGTGRARRLLAHELTHVVQQLRASSGGPGVRIGRPSLLEKSNSADRNRAGDPIVQRACLSAAECTGPIAGSLEAAVTEAEAEPANISSAAARRAACVGTLPDNSCSIVPSQSPLPACIADGHGAPATQIETFADSEAPGRRAHVKGFFVDKDIPSAWGAYTWKCECFTPPIDGGGQDCVFVPAALEAEAGQFNTPGVPTIGGKPRDEWRAQTLSTVVHETEHARFEAQTIAPPSAGACSFDDIKSELSEVAAIMSEFPDRFDFLMRQYGLDPDRLEAEQATSFARWIRDGGENISGALKNIDCLCECDDTDEYVRRMVDFVTSGWTLYQKHIYHTELRKSVWNLRWPIDPPPLPPLQRPDPSIRPPRPERPTFGPLFEPRRDFRREILESAREI
ncbi:MAG: DUF4157 domain-containing protein [Phycisphaerales bacterium]